MTAIQEAFDKAIGPKTRAMTRSEAYAWLAGELGIHVGQCHIGWFDVAQCERVEVACAKWRKGRMQ